MRNQLLLIAGLILLTISAIAQQTITGKVTDSKGAPLSGVSVKVKGTNRGTSTNNTGDFSIQAASSEDLEITIIGYKSQTLRLRHKRFPCY